VIADLLTLEFFSETFQCGRLLLNADPMRVRIVIDGTSQTLFVGEVTNPSEFAMYLMAPATL